MIRRCGDFFVLQGTQVTYALHIMDTGHAEHLYFGADLGWRASTMDEVIEEDCLALCQRRVFSAGNMIAYDDQHPWLNLEDLCLEFSTLGKGDIKEPFVVVRHGDGSNTSDFLFQEAEITQGRIPLKTLPSSYGEGAEQLSLTFVDRAAGLRLVLRYTLWTDCDVICRESLLYNDGDAPVTVERLMSNQLDFSGGAWQMTLFHGAWAREMEKQTLPIGNGWLENNSATGTSSNRANPFVMVHSPQTTETHGPCYGLNLVYSGNHCTGASVNAYGMTHLISGMNSRGFSWELKPGEVLESPESVMAFSDRGFTGMSQRMHWFVREHIVRGVWQHRSRPVLLNSWEAAYFDISELKLLRLAWAAKNAGVELFVMDDGWFGKRNDESHSLGDWTPDPKKLPNGLEGLSRKIRGMGLDFGLWIEPEMVNRDSDLYRAHPEWVMEIPGRAQSEGRNQRILDLCNPEVVDYLTQVFTKVFESAQVSYVKWDMNRIFSDVFSPSLPPARQGEVAHRYVLGLYRLMEKLTHAFPEVLFEGCASGGNRFDLGILCYCPQIWASDNTDAISRVRIQEGYSYGYPMNTVTTHVSASPNHQTLRSTPLMTRYNVSLFGVLGYELNLADLNRSQAEEVKNQITLYKSWRDLLQSGTFYRLQDGNIHKWCCVSADKTQAVVFLLQELVRPNTQEESICLAGLNPDWRYRLYSLPYQFDIRNFGDLVNTVSPVHIRQGSVVHNALARFVTLPAEVEEQTISGRVLMRAGMRLAPAYGGTGFNEKTRYFQDFGSRIYFLEKIDSEVKELTEKT